MQLKDVKHFEPNNEDFYMDLKRAQNNNVHILAYDCYVTFDEILLKYKVKAIIY